ncbi:MAG: trypsin-like peptidase domain-containing protein [Planctomycetes bacterium]|nr:trypsin-like peptidase domain-containing protein [Planctomycetota bacterium]
MRKLGVCVVLLVALLGVARAQDDGEDYEIHISSKLLELKPGEKAHVELTSGEVDLQGFKLTVPDGTKALYVNVLAATADIDLALCDSKIDDIDELEEQEVAEAMTARIEETLAFTSDDGLKAGSYVLYAGSLAAYEEEVVSFDVLLSFNDKPKLDAPTLPFKPMAGLTPLQRAVAASVMLYTEEGSGGSGTVVTPTGLIVTNRHVIEAENGGVLKQAWVSFAPDARKLPVQTHIAKLVFESEALDLALLKIATDLDGGPVEKPDFVWLPIAETELDLGDEIRCLGYPAIGGSHSLCSITLTRGVISGFEMKKDALDWYKSDCLVSAGNSGGTAINGKGEFCAIPTETLHDPDTMEFLSYIRPVQALPKDWREAIRKDLPK